MANDRDSAFVLALYALPISKQVDYLYEHKDEIEDDSNYWQILAATWINAEVCTPNLERWIKLFSSKRRNRHKVMKKGDRHNWRALPSTIRAFRAVNPGEDLERAISWSLDIKVCGRLWPNKPIEMRRFPKSEIIAYFNRRGEQEIIRLPKKEYGA